VAYDAERSAYFERRGFKVARFWNHEVLTQTDRVREAIGQRVEKLMGSPTP
jgi:adenine-specific DNA-methyltransferase